MEANSVLYLSIIYWQLSANFDKDIFDSPMCRLMLNFKELKHHGHKYKCQTVAQK